MTKRNKDRVGFGGGSGGGGGVTTVDGAAGAVVLTGVYAALMTPTAPKTAATYTAAARDFVPCDTTSNSITVTLPTAPTDGTIIGVKHVIQVGTNTVTIVTGGSDVFNKAGGATSASLPNLAESYIFQYKASSAIWYIVEHDSPRTAQYFDSLAALNPSSLAAKAPLASPVFTGVVTLPLGESADTAPVGSLVTRHGGVYVGKRALDKWRYTKQTYRTVLVLTDSLGQGDVGGLDPWPERLGRDLGNWNGPRLTAGAGYYPLYRSGSLVFGSGNGDREWAPWGTWATVAPTIAYDLTPYSSTLICTNAAATALRTVADGATTNGSVTVTSATMTYVAGDVGALITGTNIPPNTYIRAINSGTSILISQPATATGSSLTQSIHGAVLTWTRPLGSNACRNMIDNTTATNTTVVCPSANFHQLDVGKMVTGGVIPVNTIITAVTDYQTATISNAATGSGGGKQLLIHDGRTVSDMATTNTSTTMTSATAAFVSGDVGSKVIGTNVPAGTYIASVQSPTSVTLSAAATGTGSAQFLFIQTQTGMRVVIDGVSSAGTGTLTSATAAFTQNDVGRQVTGTSIANNTTITAVTNATTCTLSSNIATSTTGLWITIASTTPVNVVALEMLWIDGIASNGATAGYSTNGGTSWTTFAQTASGGPLLMKTLITVTNPTSLIIRANIGTSNTAAAKSQTIQAGINAYQATPGGAGLNLFNVARDGFQLAGFIHGGIGDSMAFLDNGLGGTFAGYRPDLIVVLFSNDQLLSTSTLWNGNLQRLLDRTQAYADVIMVGTYQMGDGRALATTQAFNAVMKALINPTSPMRWTCADGVTTNASATITSATIGFEQSDVGRTITDSAGKIPGSTTITAVASATSATISANATGSTTLNTFTITGKTVDTGNAHVDLYEAYVAQGLADYTAAAADGLMYDTVHPSQIGHNEIGGRLSRLVRLFS